MDNNTTVTRSLKEINQIFWGCLVAYDEGLLYDDIALAGALWRYVNIFCARMCMCVQVDYCETSVLIGYCEWAFCISESRRVSAI